MAYVSDTINKLAAIFGARVYLEIGLENGDTFSKVTMPHKSGADSAEASGIQLEELVQPVHMFAAAGVNHVTRSDAYDSAAGCGAGIRQVETPNSSRVNEAETEKIFTELGLADYQKGHVLNFLKSVDIRNRRIIEIGSDSELKVARALAAYGAASVMAVNAHIAESLPPLDARINISKNWFEALDLSAGDADILFGIALLEHIESPDRFAEKCRRSLQPGGYFYFTGAPMWTCSCGHHVYIQAWGETKEYIFNKPGENPWLPWQHLTVNNKAEAIEVLHKNGVKEPDATQIAHQLIKNKMISRKSPTEIISAFIMKFPNGVSILRYPDPTAKNIYYEEAKKRYGTVDLETFGLTIKGTA